MASAIKSVGAGSVKSLEEVPDDVFSQRMMGDGVAVATSDDCVKSPVSGELVTVFPTGHAFIVKDSASQADILVHIGVDTVSVADSTPGMFEIINNTGAQVNAGDDVIKVNWGLVQEKAKSDLVIVINSTPEKTVSNKKEGSSVATSDTIFEVE